MLRSNLNTLFAAAFAVCLALVATANQACAQPRAVIELFTSQSCSSCPAANRLLVEMARDQSLVALSWHVDYWDNLGWKDTFAHPAFTARQRAYGAARGDGEIYTPQVVINGVSQVVGSNRSGIDAAISNRRASELTVPVTLDETGSSVRISIGAAPADEPRAATLYLLPVFRSREVAISHGENAGHAIVDTNVVRAMTSLTTWTGEAKSVDVSLDKMGDADGYVVLLQSGSEARPGVVLGAAKGPGL
jgi:hypothetical protein